MMSSDRPNRKEGRLGIGFLPLMPLGMIVLILTVLFLAPAHGGDPKSALDTLKEMNIPFDADTFMDRVKQGDTGAVEALLKAGMDPNTKEKEGSGRTALIFSVIFGHLDITKLLLSHGADLHARDTVFHLTPFLWAAQEGESVTMKSLVQAGADVNERGINGETALMLASANGHTDTVRTLLDLGADVNARNSFGATALFDAVRMLRPEVVKVLLERGADAKVKVNGVTALTKAKKMGRSDLVQLLQNAGARE